jgi:MFS family permease
MDEDPTISKSGAGPQLERLQDITSQQWKSGLAAWLGWLFDGLDMHLYTLVAIVFVEHLLESNQMNRGDAGYYASWIQAAFLIGWALGGAFFGVIGDRIGRTRALMLTILTYALFTGLSYFSQTWWQLGIYRFIAALGIGGEWAVGASLLSETWPRRWRPWLAAVLQTGVNLGVLLAGLVGILLSGFPPRYLFLVGVLPAFLVLWIRRAVPEPEVWHKARDLTGEAAPGFFDLFQRKTRRLTGLILLVCALTLTAHWAFVFWCFQHLRKLPEVRVLTGPRQSELVAQATIVVTLSSIVGNFLAAILARRLGYRRAIVILCLVYFALMFGTYVIPRSLEELWFWMIAVGACQGLFALFTMYLPPLFPTLLRTTGAGFCYNFGRIVAAFGTVFFGLFATINDFRLPLLYASFLFLPAAAVACFLPEPPDENPAPASPLE